MRFEDALTAAGLRPRDVVADGKWRRCATEDKPKKRNGAYCLHADGRGYWRNWATDLELNSWRDEQANVKPVDQARLSAQRDRERSHRIQAMRSARAFWNDARPLNRIHSYVDRKGLTPLGCAGLRQHDGLLVIPVWLGDWIISVQTIRPEGDKLFWPGAPVKAGAYVLRRDRSAVTVFVEGLATGLAVFQSVRQASVIVCFDAGNILPVVQRIRPAGSVCIAADNDHKTKALRGMNPGIEKAKNAAEYIGAGVAYPTGIEGSDWADYPIEHGEGATRRIEREILAGSRYVQEAPS